MKTGGIIRMGEPLSIIDGILQPADPGLHKVAGFATKDILEGTELEERSDGWHFDGRRVVARPIRHDLLTINPSNNSHS